MEPAFVPDAILQLIQDEKIGCFGGVPTFFEAITRCPGFADAALTSLRLATGKLSKPAVRAAYAGAHETMERVR